MELNYAIFRSEPIMTIPDSAQRNPCSKRKPFHMQSPCTHSLGSYRFP